ncbi:MAG: 5'-deoxyadenosine deaminase [Chloroflexi bacterium]|nr:5'-deoxyadenosine deaminase [Chloroflexota bacterium]
MPSILIKNGRLITLNTVGEIFEGDILIQDRFIRQIGTQIASSADKVIEARGKVVLPGLIQTHVHLCQSLFRGLANDLDLIDWLLRKTFPFEAAHDPDTLYDAACLGLAEMIKAGTTTIVDMGTIHHHDSVFQAIQDSGIRAQSGKAMMDHQPALPPYLCETTSDALQQSVALLEKWHLKEERIRYGFAPRSPRHCTDELHQEVRRLAERYQVNIHSHAAESQKSNMETFQQRGLTQVRYFHAAGLTGPNLQLAHCIWLDEEELSILATTQTKVLHCPSANLKLGSGIAMVPEMLQRGVKVSIGADGAACNDNLDPFIEMRIAALIQKPRLGPTVLPAREVLRMATHGGAEALGLEKEIGSLEVGKRADLIILNAEGPHLAPLPDGDLVSRLIYSARSADVETTIVDGRILMEGRVLKTLDEEDVVARAKRSIQRILKRVEHK